MTSTPTGSNQGWMTSWPVPVQLCVFVSACAGAVGALLGMLAANFYWLVFLPSIAVCAVPLLVMRPLRRFPEEPAIVDWGRSLGHGWVSTADGVTYWVPGRVLATAERDLVSVEPHRASVDGLIFLVPGRPIVLPTLFHQLRWTFAATGLTFGLPFFLLLLSIGIYDFTGAGLLVFMAFILVMCAAMALFPALICWLLLATARGLASIPGARITRVEIHRQMLKVDGRTFTLGALDQDVALSGGRLVVTGGGDRLEIRGRSANLNAVRLAIDKATSEAGDRQDVPSALHGLVAEASRSARDL